MKIGLLTAAGTEAFGIGAGIEAAEAELAGTGHAEVES